MSHWAYSKEDFMIFGLLNEHKCVHLVISIFTLELSIKTINI